MNYVTTHITLEPLNVFFFRNRLVNVAIYTVNTKKLMAKATTPNLRLHAESKPQSFKIYVYTWRYQWRYVVLHRRFVYVEMVERYLLRISYIPVCICALTILANFWNWKKYLELRCHFHSDKKKCGFPLFFGNLSALNDKHCFYRFGNINQFFVFQIDVSMPLAIELFEVDVYSWHENRLEMLNEKRKKYS